MKTGNQFIEEERVRQISEEGWTIQHDDSHTNGELGRAGLCYLVADECGYTTRGDP